MRLAIDPTRAGTALAQVRELRGVSKKQFAALVGTSRSALDEYEADLRSPRVDTLDRMLRAVGCALHVDVEVPAALPSDDLASYVASVDGADPIWNWRLLVGDFVSDRFIPAPSAERAALIDRPPPSCGSVAWDCFVAALAEHVAFHAELAAPVWVLRSSRMGLDRVWFPVHGALPSSRAAAMAWSPAAFRRRLIHVDGRDIPTVPR